MKITIEFIPQRKHRYVTLGDYGTYANGDIWFKITDTGDPDYNMNILFHELFEKLSTMKAGVTDQEIDDWDFSHAEHNGEPGEILGCPYFSQHAGANVLESLLLLLQGRSRQEYDELLNKLIVEEERRLALPEGL